MEPLRKRIFNRRTIIKSAFLKFQPLIMHKKNMTIFRCQLTNWRKKPNSIHKTTISNDPILFPLFLSFFISFVSKYWNWIWLWEKLPYDILHLMCCGTGVYVTSLPNAFYLCPHPPHSNSLFKLATIERMNLAPFH